MRKSSASFTRFDVERRYFDNIFDYGHFAIYSTFDEYAYTALGPEALPAKTVNCSHSATSTVSFHFVVLKLNTTTRALTGDCRLTTASANGKCDRSR
jgi:hypothetical protein